MTKRFWIAGLTLAIAGLLSQSTHTIAGPPPNLRLPAPDYRNRLPQQPPSLPAPLPRPLPLPVPGPLGIGNPITEHGLFIPKGNGGVIIEGNSDGGGITIIKPIR